MIRGHVPAIKLGRKNKIMSYLQLNSNFKQPKRNAKQFLMWLFLQHEIRNNFFLIMSFGTFRVFKEGNEFYLS